MMEIGAAGVEEYLNIIRENPSERETAEVLLTVSISRFFRDRRMWKALEKLILEMDWSGRASCTAWCAGCGCGEEVYSLKILWEVLNSSAPLPPLDVVATDVNPAVLERAGRGVYPASGLKEMEPRLKVHFFRATGGGFAVSDRLTDRIRWVVHDFTSGIPPCTNCDLLFMRNNLLTYYDPSIAASVLKRALGCLREGGLLVIGNNETPPAGDFPLQATAAYRCIFRKASGAV